MSLTFARDQLLTVVRENRAKHAAEYDAAVLKHREKLLAKLIELHANVQMTKTPLTARDQQVNLPIPENHLEEYDRTIRMLEMTTQKEIPLSQGDFSQLVLDEWDWAMSFAANTKSYGV